MNYEDVRESLTQIRQQSDLLGGYLEAIRVRPPSSSGANAELEQCIVINKAILEEANNAEAKIPLIFTITRGVQTGYLGTGVR